ncbi:uncharacterized protein LOC131226880 [Magnolia sinica]|uniref:uncharacterized protein LOC131226880 n=1 Tax=Magnolia sinica TaxID=86752 RepID=UPI00265AB4DF|nr:uncharacterized protein LOC131226880 [Magnolia sinica]
MHKLNVDPDHKPVRQKRRAFEEERYAVIGEEVGKFLEAGFVEEIYFSDWLAKLSLSKNTMGSGSNLKETKKVVWIEECELALQELKQYMGPPPLLSKPEQGEPLLLYLAVSLATVSSVLIKEQGGKQLFVYYVRKAMVPVETRYPNIEKLALALIIFARRLQPYFQAYPIVVPTDLPLQQVLQKPEVSGRLTKSAFELSEFDINYCPCIIIKGQTVADFLVELTPRDNSLEAPPKNQVDRPGKQITS